MNPLADWPATSFIDAMATGRKMLVCVNNVAKHGVKLIQDFNSTTTDETQKQYLLQVLEDCQKTFKK